MIDNNTLNNIKLNSRIDTLQTTEIKENRLDVFDIKGAHSYEKNGNVITKYNPNNFESKYSTDYKLSKTINILEQMQVSLKIVDLDKVSYCRVDIATDISIYFNDISKFLDLIHKCIIAREKDGSAWHNVYETDLEVSSYFYKNKDKLEIQFYDKHKESNGTANFPTRMEIRFLRIVSKDLELHVKKSILLWSTVATNLEDVENVIIQVLKNKWIKEKELNPGLSLTTFTYKWADKLFTQRILKELYSFVGLSGSFKVWLQKYRKNHHIEFYTKTQLNNFSQNVIGSLKN
ncbi:hypothetical protein FC764_13995 [Clostridium botulinum]|nr:hypothetical protein [Clostridium botulinum]